MKEKELDLKDFQDGCGDCPCVFDYDCPYAIGTSECLELIKKWNKEIGPK